MGSVAFNNQPANKGHETSPQELAAACASLYADLSGLALRKQSWRPYICPFHLLMPLVPAQSRILDIGCGSGVFMGLLAHYGRIRSGFGFDASEAAIGWAQQMRMHLANGERLTFEHRDARAGLPDEEFDVVSMLDVMHHVPPPAQKTLTLEAARRVKPGGLFLYKDMVQKPAWRALANRMHDVVIAREWINYAAMRDVTEWAAEGGLVPVEDRSENMLWYGHEWTLFRRTP
ncbi:MAG: class I SAM-dependent methyltransferase [Parvularculaceae bacterium]